MSRSTLVLAACAAITFGAPGGTLAQTTDTVPAAVTVKRLPRQKLSGPRFGFTTFTGDVADMRDQAGLEPMMTQFGWQWETKIISTTGGNQALMEWVLLVGGVEQDEFNVSLGWITGYRLANGVELGVGPNFSANKDNRRITTSMVVAGGSTLPFGDFYVPVNLAVAMAKGGPRITVLTGWIIG
jgi:hypothetical protein